MVLAHLRHYRKGHIEDFVDALKDVPRYTINRYLKELRKGRLDAGGKPALCTGRA